MGITLTLKFITDCQIYPIFNYTYIESIKLSYFSGIHNFSRQTDIGYPYDVTVKRRENEGFGFVIISSLNKAGSTIGMFYFLFLFIKIVNVILILYV